MAVNIKQKEFTALIEQGRVSAHVKTCKNGTSQLEMSGLEPLFANEKRTFANQDELNEFLLEISDCITVLKQIENFVSQELAFK